MKQFPFLVRFALVCVFSFAVPLGVLAAEDTPAKRPSFSPEIEAILKKDPARVTPEENDALYNALKQHTDAQEAQREAEKERLPDTVDCFDHYRFGSVQVDLSATLEQTVPGTPMTFVGSLKNENAYPVVNGSVYVKIFRKTSEDPALIRKNGYPLVDQFALPDTYYLAAQGEKMISFDWNVPANAEGGEYFAAFFFQSAKLYHLLGLSFTDDVTGNLAPFSVTTSETEKLVSLDKHSVTLNDKPYAFAQFPPHFSQREAVTAKAKIANPQQKNTTVTLEWRLYSWDNLREETLGDTRTEVIELKPGEIRDIEYTVQPTGNSVSYLVLKMHDGLSNSFLNIRFVRDGVVETRLNFPSIKNYPLQAGEEATVFSCAHSTNFPIVSDNILTLTLTDAQGNLIHTYTYEGGITGDMMGVMDTFTPTKTYTTFNLTAKLTRSGQVMEEVTQHYRCEDIDPSLCPKTGVAGAVEDVLDNLQMKGVVIISAIVLVGIGMILIQVRKRRRGVLQGFLFVVMLGLSIGGGQAEAKSTAWSVPPMEFCAARTCTEISVQGTYKAVANYADNASVPDGSTITFTTTDKGDFTGASYANPGWQGASPYVGWYANLALATWFSHNNWFADGAVNGVLPVVSLSVTSGPATCSGMSCTVTGAGVIKIKVNFAQTQGVAGGWRVFNIPAKSVSFTFTGYIPNSAPNAPSIAGSGGNVGDSLSFSFQAKDPDGDNVHYLIDWNNDGVGDQWTPAWSGTVASNTASSASHSWASGGSKTFQARTRDSQGNNSGWTSKTITIIPNINGSCGLSHGLSFSVAPNSGLCAAGTATAVTGVGPWDWTCTGSGSGSTASCKAHVAPTVTLAGNPLAVNMGSQSTLTWNTTLAVSCTASSNDASWTGVRGISNAIGEQVTPTADPTTYTLTCFNATGGSASASVTVNLNKFLKICEDSCNSLKDSTDVTMNQNQTKHLKACYNPILLGAPNKCVNPAGNVTATTVWSKTSDPNNVAILSGGDLTSRSRNGVATISASYSAQSAGLTATVICVPTVTCNSLKAITDTYCPEETQNLGKNDCEVPISCSGTRKCNFNFREGTP